MKNKNLILLSLNARLGKEVSEALSRGLGLDFVDCGEEIIQRFLENNRLFAEFDSEQLIRDEEESIKQIVSGQGKVIFVSYEIYINNRQLFDDGLKIYLKVERDKLEKMDKLNSLTFTRRDEKLSSLCQVVKYTGATDAISQIKQILGDK